jgi:SAM-dependent methyltransferase
VTVRVTPAHRYYCRPRYDIGHGTEAGRDRGGGLITYSELLRRLKSRVPPQAKQAVRMPVARLNRARWGNLRRAEPFSDYYGFDRGTPIDRFYIERFLAERATDIRGKVLEVGNARYARAFPGSSPCEVEIVDNDETNSEATIVADLGEPKSLPAARFDCFIMTQTLQLIPDVNGALENAWQSLHSGGVLLLSAPGITRVDPKVTTSDRWRFTASGLDTLVSGVSSRARREVVAYGNLTSAVAFLLGLAAEELEESELSAVDPYFSVCVCASVRKP